MRFVHFAMLSWPATRFKKIFFFSFHTEDETDDESVDESYDDIRDADISEMEVKKAIQHLKCGKAAAPDGILAEMIKTANTRLHRT